MLIIIRFLHALFISGDGNFKQNLRDKPMDAKEFALTEKTMYFVNQNDWKMFTAGAGTGEKVVCVRCSGLNQGTEGHCRHPRAVNSMLWVSDDTLARSQEYS